MGGRGTFASGNPVPYSYRTVGEINGVKVLQGLHGKHGLPEEAHSSSAYISLYPDGTFHEMRFYDKDRYLTFEIAYHPEKNIDPSRRPVLHYHVYGRDFVRSDAVKLPKSLKKHFKKYFKGVKI